MAQRIRLGRCQTRASRMRCLLSFRIVVIVVLGAGIALSLIAQIKDGLTIELDPNMRPDAVHVHYFLTGGFGGYGDFTDRTEASAQEMFLPVDRDGQRAT